MPPFDILVSVHPSNVILGWLVIYCMSSHCYTAALMRPQLISHSCQGWRQHWGWGVLRLLAHTSGTVCQLPFAPQCSRLWCLLNISRPTWLTGTDSASEDYLGRTLQICGSSSSFIGNCCYAFMMAANTETAGLHGILYVSVTWNYEAANICMARRRVPPKAEKASENVNYIFLWTSFMDSRSLFLTNASSWNRKWTHANFWSISYHHIYCTVVLQQQCDNATLIIFISTTITKYYPLSVSVTVQCLNQSTW